MADNLESFFKKHLSDESHGEDDWNIPSDKVWENAIPEIQKKSGVFIPWKYILIFGFIALLGFASLLLMWNFQHSKDIINEENVEINNENGNENIVASFDTINNKDKNANNTVLSENIENITDLTIEKSETAIALNQNIQEDKYQKPEIKSKEVKKDILNEKAIIQQNVVENLILLENIEKNIYSENFKFENVSSKNSLETKASTTFLDSTDLEVVSFITQVIIYDSIGNKNDSSSFYSNKTEVTTKLSTDVSDLNENIGLQKSFNNKGRLGVGIYFSPTFTATSLKGDMISGIINTSPVFLYSGNYGIEAKYYLTNKLAIVVGVGKSEIKSWSKSSVDFNYNSSTEHLMPGGEKENTSQIPMPTPFGEVNTEVTFSFDGSEEIQNGELIQSQLETHQKILYLSIPLGVEYSIINRNKINWFAEGGIRFNRSVQDGSEFTSRIIHLNNEMKVMGENITGNPDFKDIYFNYYLGTGLSYRLSEKFQISTSGRFFGNIDKVNLQDNMTTNMQGFDLKIGINYFF